MSENICPLCLMPLKRAGVKTLGHTTKDHILPKSLGGTNKKSNIQMAHQRCNQVRGNHSMKWVEENRSLFTKPKMGSKKIKSIRKKYRMKGIHYIGLKGKALNKYVNCMVNYKKSTFGDLEL